MKLKRKLMAAIVSAMIAASGTGVLYADEIAMGAGNISGATSMSYDNGDVAIGEGARVNNVATYTNIYLHTEKGDLYGMIIDIDIETDGKVTQVQVNDHDIDYEVGETYKYTVDKTGDYTVKVTDDSGRVTTKGIHVEVSQGNPPSLSLDKTEKNGRCYMVITYADPQRGANSLTVNGKALTCDPLGDTVYYEINASGNYEVIVSDRAGLQTKKTLYFDLSDYDWSNSKPSLSLSKKNRNDKWYLCIKAYDNDDDIKKVTVNGEKIDFEEEGGTEEYRVTESRTYKVVVTDYDGNTTSDELYIEVDSDDSAPSLSLSEKYKNDVPYIIIEAYDNNKINKVLVNDSKISFPKNGGSVEFRAQEGSSYEVEVIDNNDHVTKKSIYIEPRNIPTPVYTPSTQTVVFTLNSRLWSKDGVIQSSMDTTPCIINSRVCLPLRYVAYALGLKGDDVKWESSTRTAVIIDGSNTLRVTLGSRTMYINGVPMRTDTAAAMVNNRIYIPISQVSKAFSDKQIDMNWNNTLKQVTITSKVN